MTILKLLTAISSKNAFMPYRTNMPPQKHCELIAPIKVFAFRVVVVTGRGTYPACSEATAAV
jgi:hypothetical protein